MELMTNVPSSIASIIQAIIIFFVVGGSVLVEKISLSSSLNQNSKEVRQMNNIFTLTFLTGLLIATMRMLPPLLLGATGEMFSERCGLTNIGLEGIMSVGAIVGFITSYFTKIHILVCLQAL